MAQWCGSGTELPWELGCWRGQFPSPIPLHSQEPVRGCHPTPPQPPAAAAHQPALASHVTQECSKKILVSLNNSDSSVVHVGRIVSRLSARAEREDCGTMLLEGGGGWGAAELQPRACGGCHRVVPLNWVLGATALPKHPARGVEKDAIAVSGVGGGTFCVPLPRKSLQKQSSNRHQEKDLMMAMGSEMMDGASAAEPRL